MSGKISGEDIFLAIGEIDDDLLMYPEAVISKRRYIKPLALAASFILCFSLVISYFVTVVFRGANSEDNSASGDFNSGYVGESTPNSPNVDGGNCDSADTNVYSSVSIDLTWLSVGHHEGAGYMPVEEGFKLFVSTVNNQLVLYIPADFMSSGEVYLNLVGGEVQTLGEYTAVGTHSKLLISTEGLLSISFAHEKGNFEINVSTVRDGVSELSVLVK